MVQAAGKTHYVWQGLRAIDQDAQASYVWGVAQSDRENQTVAYYHAARPFVCALAGQHLCAAAEPACATGWATLSTLPAREGCSTRRQLEAASLPLV